ncbi:MAG: thiosulfate oxidation carrier complex protein SoxZ [Pseudomonadales bacterium]|jgi:sulfur-oxidizing protein SoxZ
MATIRIAAPSSAQPGEVIELKALIQHDMESGFRRDQMGEQIPRFIIKHFQCLYNDRQVFAAEFFPAVAANPLLSFFVRADKSGTLEFRWIDEAGHVESEQRGITVA